MTDEEIVKRAKEAEKRTGFGELVHSTVSNGVNSAYGIGFIEGMVEYRNSLQEEPVSEELEEAADSYIKTHGEILGFGKQTFKDGAKWQKEKDEYITEDLGDYINELSKQFPEVSFAKLSRIAVRVAKWHREQMIAKAIDVEVKVDAGGYSYIPQLELYDYDKDIPLSKEGDKYKVILIKED